MTGACEYSVELNPPAQLGGSFLNRPAPVVQRPTASFSGSAHSIVVLGGADGLSAAKENRHSSTPAVGVFVSTAMDQPGVSV